MYYMAVIQNGNVPALYPYETYDAALAAFHNELAYRADSRDSTMCLIINSYGDSIKKEYWSASAQGEE